MPENITKRLFQDEMRCLCLHLSDKNFEWLLVIKNGKQSKRNGSFTGLEKERETKSFHSFIALLAKETFLKRWALEVDK